MSPLAILIIALSMSMDAFAVSAAKGAELRRPRPTEALRMGAIFGAVEGCMPVVGWLFGLVASSLITTLDHWIAFLILAALGAKMIAESVMPEHEPKPKPKQHKFRMLIVAALGTSVDSMGVGVSLAFIEANIWIAAAAIGLASFTMSTIGVMVGHAIGKRVGKIAEAIGGAVLVAIGTIILLEHTGVI